MKLEGLLPHSKAPATCPYPEPNQPKPRLLVSTSCRFILMLSFYTNLGLPGCLFPSRLPTKILSAPLLPSIRITCTVQLILLDSITRINLVGSTDHKAPRYVVFFTPLSYSRVYKKILFLINDFHFAFRRKKCNPLVHPLNLISSLSSSSALQPWVGLGLLKQMSPATPMLSIRPSVSTKSTPR